MFEYPVTIATTLPCEILPPPAFNANDAVVANDALTACKMYDAVVAVPNNDPVNELADIFCVTVSDPVNP